MIVDPFDSKQGITGEGKPAAQVYFLPLGASPLGDMSNATFIGLSEVNWGPRSDPDQIGSDTKRH